MKTCCFFALSLLLCTACQEENEDRVELQLSSSIVSTRVVGSDLQNEQIAAGQQVGVTVEGASMSYDNIPWTCLGNGMLAHQNHPIFYYPSQSLTVRAYQPYRSEPGSLFLVSVDQDNDEGYLDSDLLYAEHQVSKGVTQVNLQFHHVLSKVNVILQSLDDTDIAHASVSICGTQLSAVVENDAVSLDANAQTGDISAGIGGNTSVIVIPQTVPANTNFIKVETEGKSLFYTLPEDLTLTSGSSQTFTLRVNIHNNVLESFTSTPGEW